MDAAHRIGAVIPRLCPVADLHGHICQIGALFMRLLHADVIPAAIFVLARFILEADVNFHSKRAAARGEPWGEGRDELRLSFNFGAVADDRHGEMIGRDRWATLRP